MLQLDGFDHSDSDYSISMPPVKYYFKWEFIIANYVYQIVKLLA